MATYSRMNAAARRLAAAVAAALAVLAMLVSFEALRDLAERWNALPEGMGWTLPLMLDGLAVAGGVAALARRLDGHRAVYPWLLVLVGAAASLAGNVSHAPAATGARLVAAAPPLVAALALHLAMEEARRRHQHAATAPDQAPAAAPREPAPAAPEAPAAPGRKRVYRQLKPDERRRVRTLHARGLRAKAIAEKTGIAVQPVRAYLKQLAAEPDDPAHASAHAPAEAGAAGHHDRAAALEGSASMA